MRDQKIGRNDRCWCNSGQKYKKCHMESDRRDGGPASEGTPRGKKSRSKLILDEAGRDGMRAAGRFNAHLLDRVREFIGPGVTLTAIDDFVRKYTLDHGHVPACLGYKGFPKSSCTSVNEVVCHGIPNDYALAEGDIVNVDLTTIVAGYHGDQSETFLIGEVSDEARRLVQCTFDCLTRGIEAIKPYGTVLDIGQAIQRYAHARSYSVVEVFQGHGIGKRFHQDPGVPHYPEARSGGFVIEPGMCFTIEPMINLGTKDCVIDRRDGWTARTVDGKLSAQFEHTLLMTETGIEVLTQTENGPRPGHRF